MKFDAPATTNPIDQLKIVGQPVDRIDGRLKTTGRAGDADERHHPPRRGLWLRHRRGNPERPHRLDRRRRGAGPSGRSGRRDRRDRGQAWQGLDQCGSAAGGPEVAHYHQAIGLVVAELFEQAVAAAALVKVVYDRAEGAFDPASAKNTAVTPKTVKPESLIGDFDTGLRGCAGATRRDVHDAAITRTP